MTSNCELCKAEHLTEWKYEDDVVYVCRCKSHPAEWLIVLKRHTAYPTQEELMYLKKIALRLFPETHFREGASIRDHYHLHSVMSK